MSTEFGRLRTRLNGFADTVGRNRDGTYTVRREFFYRHGMDSVKFSQNLMERLAAQGVMVELIDRWEHYTGFRGGASVRNQSHWGVKFRVLSEETF